MARDEGLSLTVLQGVGSSPVGLYQPSVLGRWLRVAYSRCGRTMAQYNGINADEDYSVKDRQTMKNNRIVVFAASLQCTDKVKVVSRGTPRSRASVTWGIWCLASAVENDGERLGMLPTVRHEHLLGSIGRPHSSAQAQAEERGGGRRRLDWGCGNTISTSYARRKAESPKAASKS